MKSDFVWSNLAIDGIEVARPEGTLSGHAAGLPFERLVHDKLAKHFSGRVYRHYEALNRTLERSPNARTGAERNMLFGPAAMQYLVCRGKSAMSRWSLESPFEEKQNDTAESILFSDETCSFDREVVLLDVKTQNEVKKGQPPNIISANKLAEALALCLRDGTFNFDFVYIGVGWEPTKTTLRCTRTKAVSLFRMDPAVYINWAAATQVQFHPFEAKQDFPGTRMEWAQRYIDAFCHSLESRLSKENQKLERFRRVLEL